MLCARAFVLCARHVLCARAELLLCAGLLRPEVLPSPLPVVSSLLPQALLCSDLLRARAELLLRAGLLCSRAQLLLCPEVLPQAMQTAPLLPSQVPSSLLRSGLLRPGLRTELRLRWLMPRRMPSETNNGLLDS